MHSSWCATSSQYVRHSSPRHPPGPVSSPSVRILAVSSLLIKLCSSANARHCGLLTSLSQYALQSPFDSQLPNSGMGNVMFASAAYTATPIISASAPNVLAKIVRAMLFKGVILYVLEWICLDLLKRIFRNTAKRIAFFLSDLFRNRVGSEHGRAKVTCECANNKADGDP